MISPNVSNNIINKISHWLVYKQSRTATTDSMDLYMNRTVVMMASMKPIYNTYWRILSKHNIFRNTITINILEIKIFFFRNTIKINEFLKYEEKHVHYNNCFLGQAKVFPNFREYSTQMNDCERRRYYTFFTASYYCRSEDITETYGQCQRTTISYTSNVCIRK